MENRTFTYSYSAAQSKEIERIRRKYVSREENKMARLRQLDGKVESAGTLESLCLGIIGALIFGVAMCFGLRVFGNVWWPAIPLGMLGLTVMLPAYPLYRILYQKKKEELTPEILKLTDELIKKAVRD